MTKLAPEWVQTSDPVIRSPACYRWTTAPACHAFHGYIHTEYGYLINLYSEADIATNIHTYG